MTKLNYRGLKIKGVKALSSATRNTAIGYQYGRYIAVYYNLKTGELYSHLHGNGDITTYHDKYIVRVAGYSAPATMQEIIDDVWDYLRGGQCII